MRHRRFLSPPLRISYSLMHGITAHTGEGGKVDIKSAGGIASKETRA